MTKPGAHRPWKALEQRHAKRLPGGTRLWRPDYGESAPDGENATDTWDAKCLASIHAITLYIEAEKKYRAFTGDRRFHLVLFAREYPRQGDYVLARADDYADLLRKEQQLGRIIAYADENPSASIGWVIEA